MATSSTHCLQARIASARLGPLPRHGRDWPSSVSLSVWFSETCSAGETGTPQLVSGPSHSGARPEQEHEMSDNESDMFEPEQPASSSAGLESTEGAPPWNSVEAFRASQEQGGSPSAFVDSDQRGAGGAPNDEPSSPGAQPARDRVSVVALVLSILGATLFAIPLSIWGLVRTGRGAGADAVWP